MFLSFRDFCVGARVQCAAMHCHGLRASDPLSSGFFSCAVGWFCFINLSSAVDTRHFTV
jgi:hypothetical protein